MEAAAAVNTSKADARRLFFARAVRGFADGLVSVVLPGYLTRLGFSPAAIGAIVGGTLLGSAALTITVGLAGHRFERRRLLLFASFLMLLTGLGFSALTVFWALLLVAVLGTLNPSSGDVTMFLPVEQAILSESAQGTARTNLFAWYNVTGSMAAALGALAGGAPELAARTLQVSLMTAERSVFLFYAAASLLAAAAYRRLSPAVEVSVAAPSSPLARSRPIVLKLALLFSIDSFGGGFVVQSLLVLWLYRRFGLSAEEAGTVFFAAGILAALSQLLSSKVAARIGLVRTMVYTHLPANLFLIAAGVMPTAPLAVFFLLLRASLSSMDVPARQSYVMAVVPPEERAAASSVTNVPRSLASAIPPVFTGMMLDGSAFGWPLICAGVLKTAYDLLLLHQFRSVKPPEEDV